MGKCYEHANKIGIKSAKEIGLSLSSVMASLVFLGVIANQFQQIDMNESNIIEGAILLGVLGISGLGVYGGIKVRSKTEEISNEAGFRNMSKFIQCFKINRKVFLKEVIGREDE